MNEAKKNRLWLSELSRRHPVEKAFDERVVQMLDRHGLLESTLPPGLQGFVEETYRREAQRTLSYERALNALRTWQRNLRETAETLRQARAVLKSYRDETDRKAEPVESSRLSAPSNDEIVH